MLRAVLVLRIKAEFDCNAVADLSSGRLANIAVQVQIKTPVPDRHHIDAPRLRGLAVDAHENGKTFSPVWLDGFLLGWG